MIRFGTKPLTLALVLAGAAAPAAAQGTAGVFVGGLIAADVQRHPEVTGSASVARPNLSGTTAAGSILGGVFLSDRFSARLEQGWSGDYAGTAVSSMAAGLTTTTRTEQRFRMSTTAVMAGYDLPSGRAVRVALLAGIVIARERTQMRSEVEFTLPRGVYVPPGFELPPPIFEGSIIEGRATTYRAGVALGAEADWRVRPRLVIAPGLRVLTVGNVVSLRPGVSARWMF